MLHSLTDIQNYQHPFVEELSKDPQADYSTY